MKYILPLIAVLAIVTVGYSVFYQPAPELLKGEVNENVEILSWSPRVFVFHQFLTDEECDHLIAKAKPELIRSTVVDNESFNSKVDEARTSRGMFILAGHEDPILQGIEKRIALLTQIPIENGESLQVLHYSTNAEYKPHFDYFDKDTPGGLAHLNRGGQRVASFLMYLNTPEEGGETVFPTANFKVKPVKGNAVLFYNTHLDGTTDERSLHGGAPVLKGEKWLATKWFRQYEFK